MEPQPHYPPHHPDPVQAQGIRYDSRHWTDAARCELAWNGDGPAVLLTAADGSRHRWPLSPDLAHDWAATLIRLLRVVHQGR